jgi:TatD DNase family protein
MIDSHVNLHHELFAEDLEAVLARARAAGIHAMLSISDRIANTAAIAGITDHRPGLWRSAGAHPHYAKDHLDLTAEALVALAASPKVIGIGETGLDFRYGWSPQADQERVFRVHIEAARATGLPLIVHTREADDLTAAILEEESARGAFPILLHCYTSGLGLLRRGLDLGAFVSFSGIAAFKNAHDVRASVALVPPQRILLETDCPYLAPPPHRGRRNEPAFLPLVAAAVGAVHGLTGEEMAAKADAAFHALFGRARPGERLVEAA